VRGGDLSALLSYERRVYDRVAALAVDGVVPLPAGPGLGVRFDRDLLKKYAFVSGSGERT
jgi:L-alanine-DL-glutamate epimerase-like enolase superfamily enzyme